MKRLYYDEPYLSEINIKSVKKIVKDGKTYIIPSETIVYPEGGGQPSDKGYINGHEIIDIKADNDIIAYGINGNLDDNNIKMSIDFEKRYDYMQQHTGQHLLSEIIMRKYNAQTLSFSIGDSHSSIEIDLKSLSEKDIREIEKDCFKIILENRLIKTYFIEKDNPIMKKLRKPPKIEGRIRIVEIDNFDYSACGGTHLKSTGELGLIKIVKTDKVRGNIRLYYKAGYRALSDYQNKNRIISEIQKELGKSIDEIPDSVKIIKTEYEKMRRELKHYKKLEIERMIEEIKDSKEGFIIKEFEDFDIKDIKFFVKNVLNFGKNLFVYTKTPKKYVIIATKDKNIDLRKHSEKIFSLLSGRGGGRQDFIEGQATDFSKKEDLIEYLKNTLNF